MTVPFALIRSVRLMCIPPKLKESWFFLNQCELAILACPKTPQVAQLNVPVHTPSPLRVFCGAISKHLIGRIPDQCNGGHGMALYNSYLMDWGV